jgi:radical SAM/Cys-rich protein
MTTPTLQTLARTGNPLALASHQLQVLQRDGQHRAFDEALNSCGMSSIQAKGIEVLQVNLGRLCNMTCRHCHVDAGPERREIMTRDTADACLRVLERAAIRTLDLTGGAPEMNPHFRRLVSRARRLGCHVIDRSNLTILVAPGYEDLPAFLADNRVEIVASLPCYLEDNVDAQRGNGAYRRSIEAVRRLNELGYGRAGGDLTLTLVYNPVGLALPPSQADLERAYREYLSAHYGIVFSRLFTITNMPIGRFLDDLLTSGRYDEYLEKLIAAFNPAAARDVMCRTTLSVDWTGRLYDCDFNQMLDLQLQDDLPQNIRDFEPGSLSRRKIRVGRHCFGCTAGAGSGCQGAISLV